MAHDFADAFTGNEEEPDDFSASASYSQARFDSINGPAPTLHDFITAPEFLAFKELLRRATREISIADFAHLRRYYDSVWSELLEEL